MSESTVNNSLTPNQPRRVVENPEFAAFARRIIRAYSRRTADGDIEALTDLTTLAAEVDNAIRNAVTGLRAYGYSWADIARPLGITRQAAQQRWGGESS
jgi:prophage DNA circulation protein